MRCFCAIFIVLHAIFAGQIAAAPLDSGFALAPKPSADQAEKDAAYREARNRLLAAAGKYERTPYRYGGMDRKGLDCSGLVALSVFDALGISVPRSTEGLYSWVEIVQIDNAQPGDLVFFRTTKTNKISHVGILAGDGRFIHSASEGPVTGVIYSRLDEKYWSRTYAGAGRAFPAAGNDGADRENAMATGKKGGGKEKPASGKQKENGLFIGFAAAPTWNFANGNIFRGATGQIRFGTVIRPLGQQMIFGVELRPEWDNALGVFRLPFTLSLGLNDKLQIFAGPVLSFDDTGGINWLGMTGLTLSPFTVKIARTNLAPYAEIAWQSNFNNGPARNFGADLAAGFHFSTGLCLTWHM